MAMPALTSDGIVPHGRWRVTLADIESVFVDGRAEPRPSIWTEFATATAALQSITHVAALWLSGSYFTSKPDPDDIDCVYIVDDRSKPTTPQEAAVFDLFTGGQKLRKVTRLRVDSYVLPWIYRPGVEIDVASQIPLMWRGYWADLWQRRRHGPKGSTHPQDAIPERGFLEVIVGDFTATSP